MARNRPRSCAVWRAGLAGDRARAECSYGTSSLIAEAGRIRFAKVSDLLKELSFQFYESREIGIAVWCLLDSEAETDHFAVLKMRTVAVGIDPFGVSRLIANTSSTVTAASFAPTLIPLLWAAHAPCLEESCTNKMPDASR